MQLLSSLQAFQALVELLLKHEETTEDWHFAPIGGHSGVHKLFSFSLANITTLQALRMNMVFQKYLIPT
jgi:hypothetical protein